MEAPALGIAFLAGLLSFLSPCVLPLVPAYIGYLGGSAVQIGRGKAAVAATPGGTTMTVGAARWVVLLNALIFVIGFTIVFAAIGRLAGSLSSLLAENRRVIQYIAGGLLVVFGLHMIGLIRIPFLDYTRRVDGRSNSSFGYLRSFIFGLSFGVGWTPCIGPTLGLILTMSLTGKESEAWLPFLAYSIGLGVPFIATALAMGQVSAFLKRLTRRSYSLKLGAWTAIDQVNIVSLISGGLIVLMGLLVFTNSVTVLAPSISWFNV